MFSTVSSLLPIVVLVFSMSTAGLSQKKEFGPAVRNYLLSLDEEAKELDFQLRHREMSRTLYNKARARLQILRRFVEKLAAEREEDRVPEIEVLTADELGALGLSSKPAPESIEPGALLGERWKVLAIEGTRPQFFVFERAPETPAEPTDASRTAKTTDPRAVIETVVIENPARPVEQAPVTKTAPPEPEPAPQTTPSQPPPQAPQIDGPRIIRFYLPSYSQQALAKGIEGELLVSAIFRRDRKIKDIVVEKGLGYGLDERAREAVRRTEFEPAQFENKQIDVRSRIAFNFSLMKVTVRVRDTERISEERQ
jgi:TonB family protein